jgi:hypothetical protein
MHEGGYYNGASAAILDDCYHLASKFLKVKFEHNFRDANSVARELARLARGSDQQVWLDEPQVNDVTCILNE